MANTVGLSALKREVWQNELYEDVIDNLYFEQMGLMGKDDNNILQIKDELNKQTGDTITYGLGVKLGKTTGVSGDNELEGHESKIAYYSDSIVISQWRTAVRLKGRLTEQEHCFNMRTDAKEKLSIRMQEFIEMQFFLKMAGVLNPTITDINGNVLGLLDDGTSMLTWSNSANPASNTETAAGTGARYLCANSDGADALTSADKLTPQLISKLKVKALLATPKVKPLRVNGKYYYCLFVHPWQAYDLKRNEEWRQANREGGIRGDSNRIFTGAIGEWDGVLVYENEYVPFLDVDVAGHNFQSAGSGTNFLVDTFRAVLCGQQAGAFVKCNTKEGWVEKDFDYANKTGFSTGLIGAVDKVTFNSKDYGVCLLDTAATSLA